MTTVSGAGAVWLLLGLVLAGCGRESPGTPAAPAPPAEHAVAVSQVQLRSFPLFQPATGSVVPGERLEVTSRISGFLQQVPVREGQRVEAGTLLVAVDDAAVEAAVRGAEAAVAAATAELQEATAEVERFRRLAGTRALAEDELRKARVRVARAGAARVQAEAELATRRQDRRYTRILSPGPAQVRERLRDPGDLLTPGDPVLRLEMLGPMQLEVFVPAAQALGLAAGQTVAVELEGAAENLAGEIAAVIHSADAVTRRCKVRIALPEHPGLMPGRYARALFVLGADAVPSLPASALTERAGVPGVFTVDENGTARFRSLQPGRIWQDLREVLAGVEPGALVVTAPPARLRDGDRVRVPAPGDGH